MRTRQYDHVHDWDEFVESRHIDLGHWLNVIIRLGFSNAYPTSFATRYRDKWTHTE